MPEEIKIELSPEAEETLRALQAMPEAMLKNIAESMDLQNQLTISHIQATKLSQRGPTTLGVRTNRLRSSIRATDAGVLGQSVHSAIGSNVAYAAIHEFGGRIPAHDIVAKNGKALRFMIGGRIVYRSRVRIPEITMPARAYVQTSIEERADDYGVAFSEAINDAWEGN